MKKIIQKLVSSKRIGVGCPVDGTEQYPEKKYWKDVFNITWPAYIDLFLAALFGLVDSIMVARLGAYAISAAGITNQPFYLFIAVFAAVNVGSTALVAWNIGAGNRKVASDIAKQTIMINFVLGLLLGAIGWLVAEPLMVFMNVDAYTFPYAVKFFQIICAGLVFQAITMGVTACFRGCGKTRPAMLYSIGANIINVFLNYTLIYGKLGFPELGVTGSAIATTIARGICCAAAVALLFILKDIPVHVSIKQKWKPSILHIKKIFSIGIPSALEQFVIQSGLILFSRTVYTIGEVSFAAHQIALNINGLAFSTAQAFGVASTSLTGQSLGAKKVWLAEKYSKVAWSMALIASVAIGIVFVFFGKYLGLMFTDDQNIIAALLPVFVLMAFIQPGCSTQLTLAGTLRGAGDTMFPLYASILGIWVFRVVAAYIFVNTLELGLSGVWIAMLLDQTSRATIVYFRFRGGKWKYKRDLTL